MTVISGAKAKKWLDKKTTKKKSKKNKAPQVPKVSYLVKPEDMTLEEWQIALRRQAAEKEQFVIEQLNYPENPGYYAVKRTIFKKQTLKDEGSPKRKPQILGYGPTYKIVYRGEGSQWNYCSCMDFRTSGLGTCKHLEAVRLWMAANNKRPIRREPLVSSLYIDYKDDRKIKLRIGYDKDQQLQALAKNYFDSDLVMLPMDEALAFDFIKKAKEISPSFRCYTDVWDKLLEDARKKHLIAVSNEIKDSDLDTLLRTNLYPYQKEGIKFAFRHGRSIIADEMGLGKTVQAIGTAELFRRYEMITSVLVVCPTSLKYQWKYEIEKFTGATVTVVEGNSLKRQQIYESDNSFYKIVSYNAMANDVKQLGSLTTDLLIMDEVQRLKNWDTLIAKAARNIHSEFAVILSGTPLENKLEELYSIVELVDQHFLGPYYKFRDQCIITDKAGMTVGYKNLNLVGEKLKSLLIRRRKSEVALQMPKRQDKTLYVPMTKQQIELHEDFEWQVSRLVNKWRTYHFLSELDRQRLLLFLNRMRMVANSTFILDQHSRNDTKIEELVNILNEIFYNGDEKVVIFSGWERMTRLICAELDKMGIKYSNLNGSIPSAKRRTLVQDFTNDPECKVFVSTDAGATGLNLQAGSVIINMELPWNPAILEQRIGRIYRLGQQRNIQVINMVSVGSIEKQIETKIDFKSAVFSGILDQGEDMVILPDKKKFDDLIETLEKVVKDKTQTEEDNEDITEHEDVEPTISEPNDGITSDIIPDIEDEYVEEPVQESPLESDLTEETATSIEASNSEELNREFSENPEELVRQGISFLSGLVSVLKSPEKTKALVESVVKTDPNTGATSLQIPVPDKSTVTNILSLLGKLIK